MGFYGQRAHLARPEVAYDFLTPRLPPARAVRGGEGKVSGNRTAATNRPCATASGHRLVPARHFSALASFPLLPARELGQVPSCGLPATYATHPYPKKHKGTARPQRTDKARAPLIGQILLESSTFSPKLQLHRLRALVLRIELSARVNHSAFEIEDKDFSLLLPRVDQSEQCKNLADIHADMRITASHLTAIRIYKGGPRSSAPSFEAEKTPVHLSRLFRRQNRGPTASPAEKHGMEPLDRIF
ncbi:hypothetical protein FALBO_6466 [Fusarium albosuccineum]|uniref:Uncharacterized protein n=1 Tax=Fusarium albosuccineum TaxID=1237068 RepID=A0A8H4LCZ2_9HYPO|nr:hypothetical protein FALBO_6466 [Fusarium albosuccineum]